MIEEATFLSVYLERAARLQIRVSSVGTLKLVLGHLAKEAHNFMLQERFVVRHAPFMKKSPTELIFNRHLLITVAVYAMSGIPLSMSPAFQ